MQKTLFYVPALILLYAGGIGCTKKEVFIKPNIIFIMADDLGYGGLGCYGASEIPTPHCDRLASEGMIFTDAHSPSSVCSPTRYGVLTGEYAWRSWMKNWVLMEHMPLLIDPGKKTVANFLKESGYKTACLGKWHLGWGDHTDADWNGELKPGPLQVGFDYYFGVPYSHNSIPEQQVFVENNRVVGLQAGDSIQDPNVLKTVMRSLENTATELSIKAVEFIEKNKDQPFFLYYPLTNVHLPHTPHTRFKNKSQVGLYGDFVVEMDWAVGEILMKLDELDLAKKTLIIFTSDNGAKITKEWTLNGHKPNKYLRGGKAGIYEGGHRVPFIVRWPGRVAPGSSSDEIICLTDLMATCADILNVPLDDDEGKDSKSILPVLLNESLEQPIREHVIHHSVSGMFAIRMGDWKFIDGIGDGYRPTDWKATQRSGINKPEWNEIAKKFEDFYYEWPLPEVHSGEPLGQLYNLNEDMKERKNLFYEQAERVSRMKEKLEWIKSN